MRRMLAWGIALAGLAAGFVGVLVIMLSRLGNGLDLPGFVWAVTIGGAILAVYTAFLAYIGARTGLGMDLMAHHAFGTRGSFGLFTLPVTEVRLSAGAGFVVVLCGEIRTMPGLPRHPAAETIRLDSEGNIQGLF